jgi:hypothetical protein
MVINFVVLENREDRVILDLGSSITLIDCHILAIEERGRVRDGPEGVAYHPYAKFLGIKRHETQRNKWKRIGVGSTDWSNPVDCKRSTAFDGYVIETIIQI